MNNSVQLHQIPRFGAEMPTKGVAIGEIIPESSSHIAPETALQSGEVEMDQLDDFCFHSKLYANLL
jgi:ethanolamine utilization microcompartment shell protein EutS